MKGSRYVEVPAADLMTEMRDIGATVEERGGRYREGTQGDEIVVDLWPPKPHNVGHVRVYTSLAKGAKQARDCGLDAVRIVVLAPTSRDVAKERPVRESDKILRTAPQDVPDRVNAFLDRLRERIRSAYKAAGQVCFCPHCGSVMSHRDGRYGPFLGCTRFPACKQTKQIEEG